MIPISIKVTLDLTKLIYAKFVMWDSRMGSADAAVFVANTGLCEQAGQVGVVLTDKTGTLTENKMVFKRASIDGVPHFNKNEYAHQCIYLFIFPSNIE